MKKKNYAASVRVASVGFAYKAQVALEDVTLQFDRPGVYALVGSNGSGKTTLLRLLYGLLQPVSGTVVLLNARGERAAARDISFVPDDDTLIQDLTGREYLRFVADCFEVSARQARPRIEQLLRLFSLEDAADRLVRGYSHGMRKKLQLSAGILAPADIMIIDEPTNGLDPLATALASEVIAAAGKRQIVIMATHDLSLAQAIADRVVMLRQKVVAEGSPADIMKQTGTASLQQAYVKLSGIESHEALIEELFA